MIYPISNYAIITAPAAEPLSLAEAKAHLKVDFTDEDTLITSLIVAAREQVERMTGRAFITRTIDFYRDQFPGVPPWPNTPVIELPLPPLIAVTQFQYIDSALNVYNWTVSGTDLLNTTGALNAHIDTINEPGRIMLSYSQIWPNQVLKTVNALRIRLTCGYGATSATVPQAARQAMLLLIGSWYQFRESMTAGTLLTALPVPHGVDLLLAPLKNWSFA